MQILTTTTAVRIQNYSVATQIYSGPHFSSLNEVEKPYPPSSLSALSCLQSSGTVYPPTSRAMSHNGILFVPNIKYGVENFRGEGKSIVFTHIVLPNCQIREIFSRYFYDNIFVPTLPVLSLSGDSVSTSPSMGGLSRDSFKEDMGGRAGTVLVCVSF